MRRQPAQAIVWVAILVPTLFLPIVGLSIDAGVLFDARRELQNVADGAARVGAMEIDERSLHDLENTRGEVNLDRQKARQAVLDYLERAKFSGQREPIGTANNRVTVTLLRTVRPRFLALLHVQPVEISATGRAAPCSGVTREVFTCN
jgi:uncharacterized membrane protein